MNDVSKSEYLRTPRILKRNIFLFRFLAPICLWGLRICSVVCVAVAVIAWLYQWAEIDAITDDGTVVEVRYDKL